MGRSSHRSLQKLALKRPSRKIWVNQGFGIGYYKFRKPTQKANCEVVHVCESKNGLQRWDDKVPDPVLERMGLVRLKDGKIVRKDESTKEEKDA